MSEERTSAVDFPMLDEFDPHQIEARWQRVWEAERTWEVSNDAAGRDRAYVLEQLPYTSGEPHVGHLKNYTVGDAVAHYWRRQGRYVLHPMGYDAFGLPGENYAIRTGRHPRETTDESIASFRAQFKRWGLSIDWSREISSHDPAYYRWTQWIFLQLHAAGLAYRKNAAVNWCPDDETVLANEQVVNDRCERCGAPVQVRQMEQWFFRITAYADRLLDGLDALHWPGHITTMQRNWIGRSAGAYIDFATEDAVIRVFTTRPDTLFGATYLVLAPGASAGGCADRRCMAGRYRPALDRRAPIPRSRRRRLPGEDRCPAGAGTAGGHRRQDGGVHRKLRGQSGQRPADRGVHR